MLNSKVPESMRVHYIQHVHFENPGFIKTWLKDNHHVVSSTKFFEDNYFLPTVSEIDAVIVMGGPMGVYDEEKYDWLKEEKLFIKNCIAAGKKVLGICLGAQLIADCLEAKVVQANNKEIGWWPVIPTEECKKSEWFYELFKTNPIVFHWHGDEFHIPYDAHDLLISPANNCQAFSYYQNVLGLQFHLEVTENLLELMLKNGVDELTDLPFIQTTSVIKDGAKHLKHCNEIMSGILNNWIYRKENVSDH